MTIPKLQLSFHTNFALKKEDIIRLLQAANEEKGLNDSLENLMNRTSLGNKKVQPIKSWSIRSGLIIENVLSQEGKIILEVDPSLKSPVTDWLMHFYLSLSGRGLAPTPVAPADWGAWTYFVYQFLPHNPSFTVADLVYESSQIFQQEPVKNLEKNFQYLLRAYTEDCALAGCQLLKLAENDTFHARQSTLPHPYAIGYVLAKLWDRDFGEATSINTDELASQPMGLAPVLGIGRSDLQDQLDKLEALSLIEQRRTVTPFQVVRRWDDPLDLLAKAYSFNRS